MAEECITECIRRQDRIFKTVQDNITNVQGKVKKRKLEKGMAIDIQVGDRVLRQNIRSKQRKGGKLDPDYLGPYTVINVEGKSIDVVDDEGKQIPKINIDHLIHFFGGSSSKSSEVLPSCYCAFSPSRSSQVPCSASTSQIHAFPPPCYPALYTPFPAACTTTSQCAFFHAPPSCRNASWNTVFCYF